MKLSILVPAYNEEETIGPVLQRVSALELPGWEKEIIVVDDGSIDSTAHRVEAMIGDAGLGAIRLIRKANGGKGSAVREALLHARGDYVIVQDADLEYDPTDIPRLLREAAERPARVVYGSRILQRGNGRSSVFYYWGGRLLSWLTNMLYGSSISDEATGYKLVQKSLLDEVRLESDGFDFCPEVTGKILKMGVPIYEVPISYRPRSRREGKKIRWVDGWDAIRLLIKIRFSGKYPVLADGHAVPPSHAQPKRPDPQDASGVPAEPDRVLEPTPASGEISRSTSGE